MHAFCITVIIVLILIALIVIHSASVQPVLVSRLIACHPASDSPSDSPKTDDARPRHISSFAFCREFKVVSAQGGVNRNVRKLAA